jgi:predicted  nucleic acid-binding Zn-ribbon protein
MTVIAISAKKPTSDSGMEHLKYLHDQMAEATDEDEIKSLKKEIKEWSSVVVKQHKAKSEEMADGEEDMAEGEEDMAEGEEDMAEGEEDMAEGEEEYPKKKKKKVVSLMDLFNPSRPMGMR